MNNAPTRPNSRSVSVMTLPVTIPGVPLVEEVGDARW